MDTLFFPFIMMAILLVLGTLFWVLKFRLAHSGYAEGASAPARNLDNVDTVIGWEPQPSRILNVAERQAYTVLRQAFPEHMILAQVQLSRFIRVPTRNSYSIWMRRVGHLCADFVVCNRHSEVVSVVEVRSAQTAKDSASSLKRQARMDRVLKAAGIHLHIWPEERLPTVAAARANMLLGSVASAVSVPPIPATTAEYYTAAPLKDHAPGDLPEVNEIVELPEPATTWFEDLDSKAMPLEPIARY